MSLKEFEAIWKICCENKFVYFAQLVDYLNDYDRKLLKVVIDNSRFWIALMS